MDKVPELHLTFRADGFFAANDDTTVCSTPLTEAEALEVARQWIVEHGAGAAIVTHHDGPQHAPTRSTCPR